MRISDWSSDVCSSDLPRGQGGFDQRGFLPGAFPRPADHARRADRGSDGPGRRRADGRDDGPARRSEEHTSELQSLMRISYAVFCLKKKQKQTTIHTLTIKKYKTEKQKIRP